MEIVSILGHTIRIIDNVEPKQEIRMNDVSAGIYLIKITDASGQMYVRRFIKQ